MLLQRYNVCLFRLWPPHLTKYRTRLTLKNNCNAYKLNHLWCEYHPIPTTKLKIHSKIHTRCKLILKKTESAPPEEAKASLKQNLSILSWVFSCFDRYGSVEAFPLIWKTDFGLPRLCADSAGYRKPYGISIMLFCIKYSEFCGDSG